MKKVHLSVYAIEAFDSSLNYNIYYSSAPSLPVAVKLFSRLFPDLTILSVTQKDEKEVQDV